MIIFIFALFASSLALPNPSPRWVYMNGINMDGQELGIWGDLSICTTFTWARGMSIKHDTAMNGKTFTNGDDYGATGLKFYCLDDNLGQVNVAQSSEVPDKGAWLQTVYCPGAATNKLVGLQLNSKHRVGKTFDDNIGVENVRGLCQDGTIIDAYYGTFGKLSEESMESLQKNDDEVLHYNKGNVVAKSISQIEPTINDDYWGPFYTCNSVSTASYICGLQNRLDYGGGGDQAGLTDINFYCCY